MLNKYDVEKSNYYLYDNLICKEDEFAAYNSNVVAKSFIFIKQDKDEDIKLEQCNDPKNSLKPIILHKLSMGEKEESKRLMETKDGSNSLAYTVFSQLNNYYSDSNKHVLKKKLKEIKNRGNLVFISTLDVLSVETDGEDPINNRHEIFYLDVLCELAKIYEETSLIEKAIKLYKQSINLHKDFLNDQTNPIRMKCSILSNQSYKKDSIIENILPLNSMKMRQWIYQNISKQCKDLIILSLKNVSLLGQSINCLLGKYVFMERRFFHQIADYFHRGLSSKGIKKNLGIALEIYKFLALRGCFFSLYQIVIILCRRFEQSTNSFKDKKSILVLMEQMAMHYSIDIEGGTAFAKYYTKDPYGSRSSLIFELYLEANKYLKHKDLIPMLTACVISPEYKKRDLVLKKSTLDRIVKVSVPNDSLYSLFLIARRYKLSFSKTRNISDLNISCKIFDYLFEKNFIPAIMYKAKYYSDGIHKDNGVFLKKARDLGCVEASLIIANKRYKFEYGKYESIKTLDSISKQSSRLALSACRSLMNYYSRVEVNFDKYLQYLKRDFLLGSTSRINELARLSLNGYRGQPPNFVEYQKYLKIGCETGNHTCMHSMANLYAKGLFGVKKDILKAIGLYRKLHIQGSSKATSKLGQIYYDLWKKSFEQVEKDKWMRKSLGYFEVIKEIRPSVRRFIYEMYREKGIISDNYNEEILKKYREGGCIFSSLEIYCKTLPKNISSSDILKVDLVFESMVERGLKSVENKTVLFTISNLYKHGIYVRKDVTKAIKIFEKFARVKNCGSYDSVLLNFEDTLNYQKISNQEKIMFVYCKKNINDIPCYHHATFLFSEYLTQGKTNNTSIILNKLICSRISEFIEGNLIDPFRNSHISVFLSPTQIETIYSFFLSCKRSKIHIVKNIKQIILKQVLHHFIKINSN